MYDEVITQLRAAYDRNAEERDQGEISGWKVEERQHFLDLLKQEGKKRLLEIGAGPGRYGKFFQENGLEVVCTDLSPAMVRLCQAKGLTAYVMDFLHLDFPPSSFDAMYALNCLLHVPNADLPTVLQKLQALLKPGGLFYLGVYGGTDREGIQEEDHHEPKRFFSYRTDEHIQRVVSQCFEIVYFKRVSLNEKDFHFQSMVLRKSVTSSHQ